MRGTLSSKKALELLTHLDGEAFKFFFQKFTSNDDINDGIIELWGSKTSLFAGVFQSGRPLGSDPEGIKRNFGPERSPSANRSA